MRKERPEVPAIIEELNKSLEREDLQRLETLSVESIAGELGIDAHTLYHWVRNDVQFATDLHRVSESKDKILPQLRFTEDEDGVSEAYIDAMMIALVLMETKERKNSIN
jgi:transposase-like protein